jgi:hypothetical protein
VHVRQGLGHAQPRWMEGTALIVIQDAAYRRTIVQFYGLGGLVGWGHVGLDGLALGLGKRGLRSAPLCGEGITSIIRG